jgi:hypothetical protein
VQAVKAADNFANEQEQFWASSGKLAAVRAEMERVSREQGVPIQDVVEKMKPDGELSELHTKFKEAVAENPTGEKRRRAMDKAMESYVRQYGRAQEEALNPEQKGNPHFEALKGRLEKNHQRMEQNAGTMPAMVNEKGELEATQLEKLREAVAAIMEKIKQVARDFINMLTGKRGESHDVVA